MVKYGASSATSLQRVLDTGLAQKIYKRSPHHPGGLLCRGCIGGGLVYK